MLQLLLVLLLPLAAALGWFRGGRPERAAVAAILAAWAIGMALADWRLGRSAVGPALSDLGLLSALAWLALRHERWWLLVAAAAQSLAVAGHFALALQPDLTEGENLAALSVFRLLCLLALSGGVVERWLAGEQAAAPGLGASSKGGPAEA